MPLRSNEVTNIRLPVFRAIALPLLLMAGMSGFFVWQVHVLQSAVNIEDSADRIMQEAHQSLDLIIGRAAGFHGYLLTHDKTFLVPNNDNEGAVERSLARAQALVPDNSEQRQRLQDIQAAYEIWTTYTHDQLAKGTSSLPGEELKRKLQMDTIRSKVATFLQTEEQLRRIRNQETARTARQIMTRTVSLSAGAALLMAIFSLQQMAGLAKLYRGIFTSVQDNEARQQLALKAALMGSWDRDINSGREYWSAEQESLFGLQPGEFPGTHRAFLDLIVPEDRHIVETAFKDAVNRKLPYRCEYRISLQTGGLRRFTERGEVMRDQTGRPTRMVGISMVMLEPEMAGHAA